MSTNSALSARICAKTAAVVSMVAVAVSLLLSPSLLCKVQRQLTWQFTCSNAVCSNWCGDSPRRRRRGWRSPYNKRTDPHIQPSWLPGLCKIVLWIPSCTKEIAVSDFPRTKVAASAKLKQPCGHVLSCQFASSSV